MKGKRNHSLKEVHLVIAVSQNNSSTNAEDGNIRRGSFLCLTGVFFAASHQHKLQEQQIK